MRLFIKRVPRDDKMIADMEKDARDFLAEVAATVADLLEKYETRAAA
jgi:hypothetical protein